MKKVDFLIEYLLKERGDNTENLNELNDEQKWHLYRGLVNIREPNPISDEFLKIEDEFLQDKLKNSNVTDVKNIKTVSEKFEKSNVINSNKICFWQGDITKLKIGAIVNAGNSQGLGCFVPNHTCIDNQINTFAGVRLRLACNEIMNKLDYNLETGKAIITKGYNLPAQYVIQTVGPVIEDKVTESKEKDLSNCYINSLKLAIENNIRTIAFPCISTGVFRYPKDLASKVAIRTVDNFINENKETLDKVVFCLYGNEDYKYYINY